MKEVLSVVKSRGRALSVALLKDIVAAFTSVEKFLSAGETMSSQYIKCVLSIQIDGLRGVELFDEAGKIVSAVWCERVKDADQRKSLAGTLRQARFKYRLAHYKTKKVKKTSRKKTLTNQLLSCAKALAEEYKVSPAQLAAVIRAALAD